MKRVCVVTATRAEYGLLKTLIKKMNDTDELELFLLVTGMHLSSEFGYTYEEIEKDGFIIDEKIEMLIDSDSPSSIVKSMGVEIMGLADCFSRNNFSLVVVLGDRYEMLVVAEVATIFRIPIAHIYGGERTEGAIDEAIRHSITKMSHLHFASIDEYRNRIIQLGENPDNVYTIGSLGNESIRTLKLMGRDELEKSIDFKITDNTILLTYHPVTLEDNSSDVQFKEILRFLDKHQEISVIFTKANADTHGRIINAMIDEYVQKNSDRCVSFTSLGQMRYLSALQYVSCVMGNSSSGILEVPSFKIPTINIGDRQKGRTAAESVVNCKPTLDSIENAYNRIKTEEFKCNLKNTINPYDGGNTSDKIVSVIQENLKRGISLKKEFYDLK